MSTNDPHQHRMATPIGALLCATFFIMQLSSASAQATSVQFAVAVPPAPEQMQIYKLEATSAPLDFLNEKLSAIKLPTLKLEQKIYIVHGATGKEDRDRVRAFADPMSGDAHFIPNLAELTRVMKSIPLASAQSIARSALTDVHFIPQDVTQLRFADPITVMGGATAQAPANATLATAPTRTEPRIVLTMFPGIRYVSGFRVYGLGSHALVSLANDGSIVGALRRWRTASLGDRIQTSITAKQVRADIERQLRPHVAPKGTQATVDKIAVAYYDANAKYLQPVYYFEATIQPAGHMASNIKVAGYVPIGKALELIPDLAAGPSGAAPATARPPLPGRVTQWRDTPGGAGVPGDITLGEYVNQDWPNNGSYTDMANTFLSGLTFMDSISPGSTPPVSRTQWWTAYPWEVVGSQSKDFLNSVNVAYTVPHGNWLWNSTLNHNDDGWHVADIGTGGNPGFGAAAGGVLATWIIMSCEVIPSMYDRQNQAGASDNPYTAFDAWWPVFQGLHNVIGFRTIMFYPDDNLQFGFGFDASLGGDLNAAWFQEVAANEADRGTYNNKKLNGSPLVHYDRASTMVDARNLGQSIYNVGTQSASTTLWNFWMDN
jgi:hypothetical protein